jgi:hypothetical protein
MSNVLSFPSLRYNPTRDAARVDYENACSYVRAIVLYESATDPLGQEKYFSAQERRRTAFEIYRRLA